MDSHLSGEVTYHEWDIRECGHERCINQVMFSCNKWVHLPKHSLYGVYETHEAFPYPEHKHKFKILGTDGLVYLYECSICGYTSNVSRKLIRYLLTKRWIGEWW